MDKALPSGGRDCGFESRLELLAPKYNFYKNMQSVGIEPTLLRTCALSMRLNHSAKTAYFNNPRIAQLVERETVAACN